MDQIPASDSTDSGDGHRRELVREAATMALYVAICLLAALAVASHTQLEHSGTVIKVVWGTTLGLTLAHRFAFRLSSRFVASGVIGRHDAELVLAQFAGSAAVALLATVSVVLFRSSTELVATGLVITGFIGVVAFSVARSSGAPLFRSVVYALTTTLVALSIVIIKNALSGH